ncbi:MAG TPA: radical SAM protein, partial [Anaerolineae bacterium]|nr:radical SAM protein [Anaerolineae bacterium]
KYGVGSIVIHDSMFFQNPRWLEEWIDKYPRRANKVWPYWAAGRADTVRQWPDLFVALLKETNWNMVSIGFESGSDRVLKILNKECTEADNYFAIDLLNRTADEMEAEGKQAPVFWSNIMLGIPGERREDAFKTLRMLKYMKRVFPSISFYAPYPGSALGYQLIAEGKSKMSMENYHRFPDDEKVLGVDYAFYRDLLAGKYDAEVNAGLDALQAQRQHDFAAALIKA